MFTALISAVATNETALGFARLLGDIWGWGV